MGGKFKKVNPSMKKGGQLSRKEMRKQSRKEKKERKNSYHRNKSKSLEETNSDFKKVENNKKKFDGLQPKKVSFHSSVKTEESKQGNPNQIKKVQTNLLDEQNKLHKEEVREHKKLEKGMMKMRKKSLLDANKEEDKEIKRLEKQLKLNKRKSKSIPKSFADEGLDYLLEICDSDKINDISQAEMNLQESGSEFEDDFAEVTGKSKKRKVKIEHNPIESKKKKLFLKNPTESVEDVDSFAEDSDQDLSDSEEVGPVESDNINSSDENSVISGEEDDNDEDVNSEDGSNNDFDSEDDINDDVNSENDNNENINSEDDNGMDFDEEQEENKESDDDMDSNDELISEDDSNNDDSQSLSDMSGENSDGEHGISKKNKISKQPNSTWEDIYGRLRDKEGNVVQAQEKGRYIPPHLRAQQLGDSKKNSEQMQRLKKQLKGLINRLAESNLHNIANQIDELYMQNSRNDMNDCLLSLVSEALIGRVLTPERLIMEHTLLIAVLHANVGLEIGAHFLQSYVQKFDILFREEADVENKELDNVVLIISHLYNYKVFHSVLMYNILELLTQRFTEKEVELILLILRSVGFTLRKDDPLALKDLVLRLQKKANESTHLKDNPRVRFMLDVLLAVKNNNMVKIPQYDPSYSEHLKKLLKTLIHKGKYVTELKITLEDLLKAEERGRWWIVGSAWSGPAPNSAPQINSTQQQTTTQFSKAVLALARKQRMNTDTRRNIFCILMSAEDYLDAFEKLLRLGLKGQQEQEILHVMIHCLMQEKKYNPYYAHLATHFCQADRKHQMTIQYHLWDKLKELSNISPSQISNLAKFLAHLFLEKALPISVLKVMQFSEMDKPCVRLLRQILLCLLLNDSTESVVAVFSRVSKPEKLHMFRESLRLFLHHFVLRNAKDLPEDQAQMLKERGKMAETALTSEDMSKKFL